MFWNECVNSSGPLTEDDFLAAIKAIRDRPYSPDPCQLGQHVVSPKALYRPGVYFCVTCMCPVDVTIPLSER